MFCEQFLRAPILKAQLGTDDLTMEQENFSVPGGNCQLAKLGRFKSTACNFLVYIITLS